MCAVTSAQEKALPQLSMDDAARVQEFYRVASSISRQGLARMEQSSYAAPAGDC